MINKRSNKASGKSLGASKDPKSRVSKSSGGKNAVKRPPPSQQKTKPASSHATANKKKKRVYTEKELGIPALNMITPIGVEKPRGKKKGKVFVDDAESMMTIMAMVNAEKEGQIESKMMRARQMEEIREARKKEQEARGEEAKSRLEAKKDELRKGRNRRKDKGSKEAALPDEGPKVKKDYKMKKRVSFG